MLTIATLFSGGEGVGIGARAAGLRHLWGIECDADIAAVACINGFDATVDDVRKVDPANFHAPDVLHASPPCPNFSTAKTNKGETKQDTELAQAVARFIQVLQPRWFTLENVYRYRKSRSWRIIAQALSRAGYLFDLAHLDAADFGVPQNRMRMWVRAVRGGLVPHLPAPEPWRGWYAAIEDLLPNLPDAKWPAWQLERMCDDLKNSADDFLASQNTSSDHSGNEYPLCTKGAIEPAYTVTAASNQLDMRARINGRVVRLSPRCLARFQSFPDSYILPESKTLAARIIGNAVPPLQYEKIIRNLCPCPPA